MEEGFSGKVLEEKDTNCSLEPSVRLLEEVAMGQVSKEPGQEKWNFH